MSTATFKKMSRALVIELALAIALASFNVTIPEGRSVASNWRFVATHPTILLHVIVAVAILVTAVVVLAKSVRSRNRRWLVLSVTGFVFVLLAFASGADYVAALRNSADDLMGIGWFGATLTYATGWYLARRTVRQEHGTLAPGS